MGGSTANPTHLDTKQKQSEYEFVDYIARHPQVSRKSRKGKKSQSSKHSFTTGTFPKSKKTPSSQVSSATTLSTMVEKLIDGHNMTYWNSLDCNLDICPLEASFWDYRPSLALNSLLISLFSLSLVLHIGQGVKYKTWGFLISMFFGCFAEIVGYGGRVWAYHKPFAMDPFLMQICSLTIAPAFLCAGIYLCLSRIVMVFGAKTSRIPPKAYTYIFVTCDFISLSLQGAGGGIASTLSQDNKDPASGNNIMLAGLGFQVFTLVLFMLLCAEYAYRIKTSTQDFDATHAKLRSSKKFRAFLVALSLSTVLILIRSIYRVVEMAEGWEGALIKNETLFFVLEGVMVIAAVLVLNAFHPGWCFREAYADRLEVEKNQDYASEREMGLK